MIDLAKIVDDQIKKIEIRILKTAEERDESSTPNESNHKLTRQISDQLYNSLVDEKHHLISLKRKACKYSKIYKITNNSSRVMISYFIVPDGLGGIMIENTLLVGESSPIGKILSAKNIGDTYVFNDVMYSVVDIFENV